MFFIPCQSVVKFELDLVCFLMKTSFIHFLGFSRKSGISNVKFITPLMLEVNVVPLAKCYGFFAFAPITGKSFLRDTKNTMPAKRKA